MYTWIVEALGIDPVRDELATSVAESMGPYTPLSLVLEEFRPVSIVVCPGPTLRETLTTLGPELRALRSRVTIVAVDGASRPLLEKGIVPHVVVTDLDGGDEPLLQCCAEGSIMVVHIHGDNIEAFLRLVPSFRRLGCRVVVTRQTLSRGLTHYTSFIGGFTDGDRAVHLSLLAGSTPVLVSMDLGYVVGASSKGWSHDSKALWRKLVKMEIARELISRLSRTHAIYSLTPTPIPGVVQLSLEDLRRLVECSGA